MQNIHKEDVQDLLNQQVSPAVTIYIPMHTTASPPHLTENQIRFKNLIYKAAEQLPKHGAGAELATQLRTAVEQRHNDLSFWEAQTPGLLLCASSASIKMFHLPIDTEEYVAVDEQFHLAPVLSLLQDEQHYYVLTIAQHEPHLYKGDLYGLQPAGIELPSSVQAALGIDEANQKSENQGSAVGPSTDTSWFNGRGGARDPREADRMRFFRMIDKILYESADRSWPVILAGIDAEVAEYRSISKYPKLLKGSIAGNFSDTLAQELFPRALTIVQKELIEPEHAAAIEEFERVHGANPDRALQDQKRILEAAEQGRVDKLLTVMSRKTTDTVRDRAEAVMRITFPDTKTSRTLNQLALQVWQMSGKVINILPGQMPNGTLMAARLRY